MFDDRPNKSAEPDLEMNLSNSLVTNRLARRPTQLKVDGG